VLDDNQLTSSVLHVFRVQVSLLDPGCIG